MTSFIHILLSPLVLGVVASLLFSQLLSLAHSHTLCAILNLTPAAHILILFLSLSHQLPLTHMH